MPMCLLCTGGYTMCKTCTQLRMDNKDMNLIVKK